MLGVGHLVVVQLVVLGGGTPQPDGALGLDEDTTAGVDIDLVVVLEVEFVVGSPEPGVLDVGAGLGGDVQEHEGGHALLLGGGLLLGRLGASVALELSASSTTNTEVDIPHTGGTLGSAGKVPLHEDSTRGGTLSGDDEVAHLHRAGLTLLADLEEGNGILLIGELLAVCHEHRPDLTSDLDVLGDLDGGGDDVGTVVEVDNLTVLVAVENLLDSLGVIGGPITLGTSRLDADKVGGLNFLVEGLGAFENGAVLEKTCGLGGDLHGALGTGRRNGVLGTASASTAAAIAARLRGRSRAAVGALGGTSGNGGSVDSCASGLLNDSTGSRRDSGSLRHDGHLGGNRSLAGSRGSRDSLRSLGSIRGATEQRVQSVQNRQTGVR